MFRPRTVDKDFVLDGLSVIGMDLPALLADLEAFNVHLRQTDSDGIPESRSFFMGRRVPGRVIWQGISRRDLIVKLSPSAGAISCPRTSAKLNNVSGQRTTRLQQKRLF